MDRHVLERIPQRLLGRASNGGSDPKAMGRTDA